MKITLEPTDGEYFPVDWDVIKHGKDALDCLCDVGNYLRSQERHGDPPDDIYKIYERFFEIMSDHNLDRDVIGF